MNYSTLTAKFSAGDRYCFPSTPDLWDETLREGAERSSISPTLDQKCEIAIALSDIGVRTLVVGMLPDVPQNITLLEGLLDLQERGRLAAQMRFIMISHVGITFAQSVATLMSLQRPLDRVWILAIHGSSDVQIRHLFPAILTKDPAVDFNGDAWQTLGDAERRAKNIEWLEAFLPRVQSYPGAGVAFGLLDAFRADLDHLRSLVSLLGRHEVEQVRLVDTAGSCLPHQLQPYVGDLVVAHPGIQFFGHFHDDFGMATANAVVGLSMGLRGVDVSVGGLANRAGHPPLAEVVTSLHYLYGVHLSGFRYDQLTALSRKVEQVYCMMESPCNSITGVATHSILSGIRTDLIDKAPQIFDIVEPGFVGGDLTRFFGVRSGRDGMLRFLRAHRQELCVGRVVDEAFADEVFSVVEAEWVRRSEVAADGLRAAIRQQHELLRSAAFTEGELKRLVAERFGRSSLNQGVQHVGQLQRQ